MTNQHGDRARPGRWPLAAVAGAWALTLTAASAEAGDGTPAAPQPAAKRLGLFGPRKPKGINDGPVADAGTLGYGPPGVQPGYQGFSLKFHPGLGYGVGARGVGGEGGYPLYGGPGYPHPAPDLQRTRRIAPFAYFGGPGGPTPNCPQYFGADAGPLAPDPQVVTVEGDAPEAGSFGLFTGAIPYPEATFAPSSGPAYAGTGGGSGATSGGPGTAGRTQPPTPPVGDEPGARPETNQMLGVDVEPFVDATVARGLKVIGVRPGGVADKAGLAPGDVIRSINGQLPEQPVDLTRIIARAAPEYVLVVDLRAADGAIRVVTIRLP